MNFHVNASFDQLKTDLGTEVLKCIGRWYWEISFFVTRFVTKVWVLFATGIPTSLNRIDGIETGVLVLSVADVIEKIEFCLWSPVTYISDPSGL
jgi:hypothetical protein